MSRGVHGASRRGGPAGVPRGDPQERFAVDTGPCGCGHCPTWSRQSRISGFFAGQKRQRVVSSLYPNLLHPLTINPITFKHGLFEKKKRKTLLQPLLLAGGGGGWGGDEVGDSHAVHTPRHVDSGHRCLPRAEPLGPREPTPGQQPAVRTPSLPRRRPELRHTFLSVDRAGYRHLR